MATVVLTGHLAFGMVSIPIGLYVAARAETIRFTRLQRRKRSSFPAPQVSAAAPKLFAGSEDLDKSSSVASRIGNDLSSNGFGRNPDFHARTGDHSAAPYSEAVGYYRRRQVLHSDADGRHIVPHELVKGYQPEPGR